MVPAESIRTNLIIFLYKSEKAPINEIVPIGEKTLLVILTSLVTPLLFQYDIS